MVCGQAQREKGGVQAGRMVPSCDVQFPRALFNRPLNTKRHFIRKELIRWQEVGWQYWSSIVKMTCVCLRVYPIQYSGGSMSRLQRLTMTISIPSLTKRYGKHTMPTIPIWESAVGRRIEGDANRELFFQPLSH